ncbi:MAG TPA: hypothetical protein VL282_02015 [Tepidisphaeraceae bacterium]|nr:hypothetical protein [Tepidisphaeraceae bacterium]
MRRLSLAFILALHLPASAGWLWLMPRGWPIASPRFWMNEVAPIAIFLVATTAIVALMMKRERLLLILAMPIASLWLAASVAALVVFPMSGWLITIRLFPLAALMLLAQLPFRKSLRRWQAFGVLVGIAIGAAMTFAERAPAPETRPLNLALAALPPDAKYEPTSIPVGEIAHLSARSGDVQIAGDGPLLVEISPLLTFISCSPDAGWVNFTLPIDRTRPHYALDRIARRGNSVMASYLPQAFLRVTPRDADNAVDIEADTPVTQPTYSHLNTFCELSVAGHKKLSISFSPCPDEKFEVTYYDYPFGRPATFACLGDDGIFRILRATSSEKGPFTTLGSGPLARRAAHDDALRYRRCVYAHHTRGLVCAAQHPTVTDGGMEGAGQRDRVQPGDGSPLIPRRQLYHPRRDECRPRLRQRRPCAGHLSKSHARRAVTVDLAAVQSEGMPFRLQSARHRRRGLC